MPKMDGYQAIKEIKKLYFEECKKDCWYSSMRSLFRPGVKEKTDTEFKIK